MKRSRRRLTSGRTVVVAGSPMRVQWQASNLDAHYGRHPGGRDRACWTDLLNSPAEQISKQDYEQESYDVVQDPQLHYAKREEVDDELREVFVDGRLVQTITGPPDNGTLSVITCYHKHFDGRHRTEPREVLIREFLFFLERDRDSNLWHELVFRKGPQAP